MSWRGSAAHVVRPVAQAVGQSRCWRWSQARRSPSGSSALPWLVGQGGPDRPADASFRLHETSRLGPDYSGMRQRGPRPAGVARAAAGVPMRRSSAAERVQRARGPARAGLGVLTPRGYPLLTGCAIMPASAVPNASRCHVARLQPAGLVATVFQKTRARARGLSAPNVIRLLSSRNAAVWASCRSNSGPSDRRSRVRSR